MKKRKLFISILTLLTFVFVLPGTSVIGDDDEIVMHNNLKYHKSMLKALEPVDLIKIPLGKEAASVAGAEQDQERYTEGVPYAFRSAENGGMWILDSANKALKLFDSSGKLKNMLSLSNMGPVVRDFALSGDEGFWLLSPLEGFIYRIDNQGKILSRIEGFQHAQAIEVASNKDLLVDMPMMAAVLRFGADETLKEKYAYEQGLSLHEGVGNRLLGLTMEDRNVKLTMRTIASPSKNITLEQFPLDIENEKVTYAGAEIIGRDAVGNIYLNLIACHFDGPIYRDRLYRCNQLGKVMAYTDILTIPFLAPDLPRNKIVTADGKVVFFYLDKNTYVLAGYSIPES